LFGPAYDFHFCSGSTLERYAASHHIPRLAHGLSRAHRRAASRLRQLFPAAANRRAGNFLSQAEPALLLATAASLLGLTIAFLVAPETGITIWIASVAVFSVASLSNGINFSVTTLDLRARGMTLSRLPLTVWAWFINAILSTLIFSILLAASVCLLSTAFLSTHFFPLNFLAGQPASFVANFLPVLWAAPLLVFSRKPKSTSPMLPCFGLTTHLISTFFPQAGMDGTASWF